MDVRAKLRLDTESAPRADRVFWVYYRGDPDGRHGGIYAAGDVVEIPVELAGPMDPFPGAAELIRHPIGNRHKLADATLHVGVFALRVVDDGPDGRAVLREDGHAVVAVGRHRMPATPPDIVSDAAIGVFDDHYDKSDVGRERRIPLRAMKNPPEGESWVAADIHKTGTAVRVACSKGYRVWDASQPYHDVARAASVEALRYNSNKAKLVSNPALRGMVPYGGSLCGFAPVAHMREAWHSMPMPGFFGVPEARPAALSPSLWRMYVSLAGQLCGFSEREFLKAFGSIKAFKGPKMEGYRRIGPHLVPMLLGAEAAGSKEASKLLNSLEAVAGVAVSASGFTMQWASELFNNITGVEKLGTEQDCEDQAIATVATIGALIGPDGVALAKTPADKSKRGYFLHQTIAALVRAWVESAGVAYGMVNLSAAVPPHGRRAGHNAKKSSLSGHAWPFVEAYDHYRPARRQRRHFVEATCPYLPHPGPETDDDPAHEIAHYVGAFTLLYGKALSLYSDKNLIQAATYRTPQLLPAERYKAVAFVLEHKRSFYALGKDYNPNTAEEPAHVGVDAHVFAVGKDDLLLDAAHAFKRSTIKLYREVFSDFGLRREPDTVRCPTLADIVAGKHEFLANHGGYRFHRRDGAVPEIRRVARTIADTAGVHEGIPASCAVAISAFDWGHKSRAILESLKAAVAEAKKQNRRCVHGILELPLVDLIIVGIEAEAPAAEAEAIDAARLRAYPEMSRAEVEKLIRGHERIDSRALMEANSRVFDMALVREAHRAARFHLARAAFVHVHKEALDDFEDAALRGAGETVAFLDAEYDKHVRHF